MFFELVTFSQDFLNDGVCGLQEAILPGTSKNVSVLLDTDISVHTPIPFTPMNLTVLFQGWIIESFNLEETLKMIDSNLDKVEFRYFH